MLRVARSLWSAGLARSSCAQFASLGHVRGFTSVSASSTSASSDANQTVNVAQNSSNNGQTSEAGSNSAPAAAPKPTRVYVPGPDVPKLGPLRSAKVMLHKGEEVWLCTCGLSETQPFCDGSHENTKFEPIQFIAPEEKIYSFCQCKFSNKMPFCDGEHKKFPGYVPPARKTQ